MKNYSFLTLRTCGYLINAHHVMVTIAIRTQCFNLIGQSYTFSYEIQTKTQVGYIGLSTRI